MQIFGEVAPGGGFQAGAIFASSFAAYDLSVKSFDKSIEAKTLLAYAAIGVLLYGFTGFYSIVVGQNFLDYDVLFSYNPQAAGIILVELGVGITVSAVMIFLYKEIKNAF